GSDSSIGDSHSVRQRSSGHFAGARRVRSARPRDARSRERVRSSTRAGKSLRRSLGPREIRLLRGLPARPDRAIASSESQSRGSGAYRLPILWERQLMDFDIAIVGSGFAGSLLALICRRLGRSVVLVEKGAHPRFAIGESSSPLANLLLEELSDRYDLPRIRPLASWGTWQASYPKIACGLKRGFTFYHHKAGEPFWTDPLRRNQLLVAASPRDEVADTHWFRADFDSFLVGEAQAAGADYLERTTLSHFEIVPDGIAVSGLRGSLHVRLKARLLIDASGARSFVH